MKKIIVAGAGHGGVTAALNLARAGYDVTVYEKQKFEDMGYDWVDCVYKPAFEANGYVCPDESNFGPMVDQGYHNPKKNVKVVVEHVHGSVLGYIERKFLIKYIIEAAEKEGVKFVFNAEIICALYDEKRVTGIRVIENGKEKDAFGDMVIDAAGIHSPVRSTLPDGFGVRQKAHEDESFYTWRGSFRKTREFTATPKNTIYFFHCGKKGMDWAIDDPDSIDILIGGFGSLTDGDIQKALDDFHKEYPIEDTPMRGGTKACIPLGRFLSVMVCNNYAAVGDSAFMTEPLSGSGVDISMYCGKILAETIIEANGDYSVEKLWKYNYRVFTEHGSNKYNNLIVKSFLSILNADDMDFFFEKKILTAKEIGGGGNTKYTVSDILAKASILAKPRLIPGLLKIAEKSMLINKVKQTLPEAYNEAAVEKWKTVYSKLR